MTPKAAVRQEEVHDAFEELYYALKDAYWAASTIQDKDRIRGIQDVVFEIITALNQTDIASRTEAFKELTDSFATAQKKLKALQNDVDKIIHATEIATKVMQGITKALAMAGKFFPI